MSSMNLGKDLRCRRLNARGRSVIVAIDHGNAAGVVRGLENPVEVVKMCAAGGADGILVTPGLLALVSEEVGNLAILLRLDGCVSTIGPEGPMRVYCDVEKAVAMGVDAVVLNATIGAPWEAEELEKVGRISAEGRRWGMPVVAEVLSARMMANHMDFTGKGEALLPDDIASDVAMAARMGVELGADAIKTRYGGDVESFRRTVGQCGRPILVAGGPLRDSSIESTLRLVDDVLEAGAGGVIFGRQIWQQPDPSQALRAVSAMVHDDATVEEALDAVRV
jgi:fructose-bisphosphate aldolase/2-amino-3,7-dideoxy-D-threo-hept-6-ulosonate synthase